MLMHQHLFIISHRRSGTHLTIDSVRNNFSIYRKLPLLTIDTMSEASTNRLHEPVSYEEMKTELAKGPRVIKTHFLPNLEQYLPADKMALYQEAYNSAHKIYVYRDGKDVMVSLFYYLKRLHPSF